MSFFFICVLALVAGYFVYGKVVERIFVINPDRPTPCCEYRDDCDFIPMATWKVYFIQLLDIAGLGPIFGPILGALYGPSALLWIVFGCIFAGGVHDYMSGMLSVRSKGQSIPEVVGNFMGMSARQVMRVFSVILLLLVGVVFVLGPAKLLGQMLGMNVQLLVGIIFLYYFLATILPISTLIGRLYPIFGALLLFMSIGVVVALVIKGYHIPSLDFAVNTHPGDKPIWPLLFITLSCGAISGFHSTQSPLMARCIQNENRGRMVFYGAMIVEGIIALIWATAGLSFYDNPAAMQSVIAAASPAGVVNEVCNSLLGHVGGFLAILGVVVLPITSGDTAFRSTRLILADAFNIPQVKAAKRLLIAIPLFVIAFVISTQDFAIIWRYFGWSNQTLATLVLWASAIYFAQNQRFHWIATIPAVFMTAVVVSFILQAPIGLNLPAALSNGVGVASGVASLILFLVYVGRCCRNGVPSSPA
ncbi:carbon starvation protein A [Oceanidesulfovibrio marinus]|uniref:Carbon starvation protein A n=1 Tax=Oceanidesulfovibrio marinus TaxID=370038 RepID=A0A6P1ZIV6_9BACT|nr:carbon starvation protein A [Oceanidesulfovibrio marinus]QJT07595.1 carbon starvation protein A [Oceanidesulfovibrio marinus]TVM34492.1 carbon starvation protein A [Oceanidesulfovibrio marinus]